MKVYAGDEAAFEAIFKRHYAPLLSYCRHMLGNQDEAEDALQQCFIRAHKALASHPPPRELRPVALCHRSQLLPLGDRGAAPDGPDRG